MLRCFRRCVDVVIGMMCSDCCDYDVLIGCRFTCVASMRAVVLYCFMCCIMDLLFALANERV